MADVEVEIECRGAPPWRGTATDAPLLHLCDAHGAPIEVSCRAASCSTCRVQVLLGADLLTPPDAMEQELLDALGNPAGIRFACSALLRADALGRLRLRPLGPAF